MRMTRRERWSRISRELGKLEKLLAPLEVDGVSFDLVHMATSMACYAENGDEGVDPPPRGAAREDWSEAKETDLVGITDPAIRAQITVVNKAFRGR